jgi:multiple sugar transport system substrate-binding protein
VGWSYRKDWFEDPAEMEAFKARYGYDLVLPQNWKQLIDIAEFFHRPDENRYGIAIYTDNSYDGLVMGVENAIFSYGGDLADYPTHQVDGILNSEKSIEGLEAYRKLYGFTPPGWSKTFFVENNQAITESLTAMSMNYFAFFPALVNPATNPWADRELRSCPVRKTRRRRSSFLNGSSRKTPRNAGQNRATIPRMQRRWKAKSFAT